MVPKQPICPEQNVFGKNHSYYFHLPMALSIVQNLKRFLERIQNFGDAPFLAQSGPFVPNNFLLWKIITIIPIYLLPPFFVQNLKNILPAHPEL